MQTSINKYQQTCVNYSEKILFNYNNQFLIYSYKKIQLAHKQNKYRKSRKQCCRCKACTGQKNVIMLYIKLAMHSVHASSSQLLKSTQVTCCCQVKSSRMWSSRRWSTWGHFILKSGHVSVPQRLGGLITISIT